MARARLLHSKIVQNKALNDLSCDTSRLAFTWLISFADREGRTYGDPAMLCSMLFPRRRDVSIEDMEGYLREWHANKLIIWYKRDGDLWISFPKFLDLQTGFDRRKEPASTIPAPPKHWTPESPIDMDAAPDEPAGREYSSRGYCDSDNGTPIEPEVRTEYVPGTCQERTEYRINEGEEEDKENLPPSPPTPSDNGREREIAPTAQPESPAFRQAVAYCESMSAARVSERLRQRIQNAITQYGEHETLAACRVALDHSAHSWRYVERVLEGGTRIVPAPLPRGQPRASPGPMAPVYNSATEQYERLNPETRAWEAVEQDDQGNWRVIPWLSGGDDDGTSD